MLGRAAGAPARCPRARWHEGDEPGDRGQRLIRAVDDEVDEAVLGRIDRRGATGDGEAGPVDEHREVAGRREQRADLGRVTEDSSRHRDPVLAPDEGVERTELGEPFGTGDLAAPDAAAVGEVHERDALADGQVHQPLEALVADDPAGAVEDGRVVGGDHDGGPADRGEPTDPGVAGMDRPGGVPSRVGVLEGVGERPDLLEAARVDEGGDARPHVAACLVGVGAAVDELGAGVVLLQRGGAERRHPGDSRRRVGARRRHGQHVLQPASGRSASAGTRRWARRARSATSTSRVDDGAIISSTP